MVDGRCASSALHGSQRGESNDVVINYNLNALLAFSGGKYQLANTTRATNICSDIYLQTSCSPQQRNQEVAASLQAVEITFPSSSTRDETSQGQK